MTRAIAIFALALLVASCASPGASPSPSASSSVSSPSPSATAVLPSASAVPSPDADGVLAIAHIAWGDLGPELTARVLTVLTDGRVITDKNFPDLGYAVREVRQLTAEGVQWLRTKMTESGLFTGDRTLEATLRPGSTPQASGGAGDAIVVVNNGQKVTVGRNLYLSVVYEETPELARFEGLLKVLSDLDPSVPAAMWAVKVPRPYAAPRFELCADRSIRLDAGLRPPVDVADVAWPVAVTSESWGEPEPAYSPKARCAAVDPLTARAVLAAFDQALAAAGASPRPDPSIDTGLTGVTLSCDWEAQNVTLNINLTALLPDQKRSWLE